MLHLCASIVTAIELLSKDTEDFCQLSSVVLLCWLFLWRCF